MTQKKNQFKTQTFFPFMRYVTFVGKQITNDGLVINTIFWINLGSIFSVFSTFKLNSRYYTWNRKIKNKKNFFTRFLGDFFSKCKNYVVRSIAQSHDIYYAYDLIFHSLWIARAKRIFSQENKIYDFILIKVYWYFSNFSSLQVKWSRLSKIWSTFMYTW